MEESILYEEQIDIVEEDEILVEESDVLANEEISSDVDLEEIVTYEIYNETDLSNVESLLQQNIEVGLRIHTAQLFCIGVLSALLVCVLLYKFIKLFY